ncbi:hypothetical protein Pmar_PMAR014569 [Perkinsus marinus ATCC 50983]|uniref:Aminotransferase class V domain-containing protein n=1 Tax=Perkinsus marinus (strain ATCC 50983 / TXsc) TaxID=423536 RepID=C5LIF0_PERM5|nr:hypothetical protein Pmar_PMAR014569 [Perkinsus marinus ATCC 50983]EER03353.1 hypothetical protein Pmar_PMAR014569 [Perkinsus marinus ATCC 50983]|eukprot:XP_002771537.1 hypothetical protein Pmar_PMAR014569 [Perkinsus marinus ATCC 50983]
MFTLIQATFAMNLGELRSPKNFRVYSGSSAMPEYEAIVNSLREQCRSLTSVEEFISSTVCPTYVEVISAESAVVKSCRYANTHSMASATARQTMRYREDAREEIRKYFNCTAEDSVIFCGAGATAAIDRFIGIMCRSRIFATDASPRGLRRAVRSSLTKTLALIVAIQVLIVDPAAHHSSLLPFRELASNYPLIRPAPTGQIHAKTLPLCPVKGTASVEGLEKAVLSKH